MNLKNFLNIESLSKYISNNIESIPKNYDDIFLSVNDIFKYKKANCIDLALLYHKFFELHNIKHRIFQIGLYKYTKMWQIGQYHICTYFFNKNRYKIVQNLLIGRIKNEIFIGNNDLFFTLIRFKNYFLPAYKQLTSLYNAEEIIKILSYRDILELDLYIINNDIYNKQNKFHKLIEQYNNIL